MSLTTIGGIGGTGYLVIKYRERASAERAERDAEQDRAEQRLLSGVQQLGSESPQVRIAGVYSLASVADTYRGEYRQRVVSILCGYLRTQRGEWRTIVNEQDGLEQSSEEKVYVSHDGAVESTVLEVLIRHLRKRREKTKHREAVTQLVEDDQLWCDCTIDLHDAVLTEIADFERATFNDADFQDATFKRDANFWDATFSRSAPPMGLPPEQVDEDGLPHGARWADADDEGLEAGSPDDAPAEDTGPGSTGSAAS